MSIQLGLERTLPDQKKKQRSFQETPLLINSTLNIALSQDPIYGAKTLSLSKGQGGNYE